MKLNYDGDLFDAIELGDLESAKIYWSEDIEIDYQEKGGNSMLMLAVSYGFKDVVEFLLSKQPNLNLKNDQGQTAADIAKEKGYDQILNLIKKST
jgi:ankyrin repeat protein